MRPFLQLTNITSTVYQDLPGDRDAFTKRGRRMRVLSVRRPIGSLSLSLYEQHYGLGFGGFPLADRPHPARLF